MFFRSEDAPLPHEYERALLRVRLAFKDPIICGVALGWDVTSFVRDDWTSTYTAFSAALDSKFQTPVILRDNLNCDLRDNEEDLDYYICTTDW